MKKLKDVLKKIGKLFTLSVLCPIVLTSCVGTNPFKGTPEKIGGDNGEILRYNETDAPDGAYIKREYDFFPFLTAGIDDTVRPIKMIYSTYDNFVPHMLPGDTMVIVNSTSTPSIENLKIYKMEDMGWTLGINFYVDNSTYGKDQVRFGDEISSYSVDAPIISGIDKDSNPFITEIVANDGTAIEFTGKLLNRAGFIKGLVKGGEYRLNYYAGTKFNSVTLHADSHVFVEEQADPLLPVELEPTKSSYFNVILPELDPGYYILRGYGFFMVE